jgi:hypothetical protein
MEIFQIFEELAYGRSALPSYKLVLPLVLHHAIHFIWTVHFKWTTHIVARNLKKMGDCWDGQTTHLSSLATINGGLATVGGRDHS